MHPVEYVGWALAVFGVAYVVAELVSDWIGLLGPLVFVVVGVGLVLVGRGRKGGER